MNMSYTYDDLDRLTLVDGDVHQEFHYDALGNRTWSSDLGTYQTNSARPHAVTRIVGDRSGVDDRIFGYDENGNMTLRDGAQIQWTEDNQPTWFEAKDGSWMRALYDASGERIFLPGSLMKSSTTT